MKKWILLSMALLIANKVQAVKRVELCHMEPVIREIAGEPEQELNWLRSYLKDKQIIFVSGYLGCTRSEFRDSMAVIERIDPDVPVNRICPPSERSVENNVEYVRRQIRLIAAHNPNRNIVLIGQSKGGVEIVQTLAVYPELMRPNERRGYHVAGVVTISAPFGGSAIADLLLGENPLLTEQWEEFAIVNKIPDNGLVRLITRIFIGATFDGFESLTTVRSEERKRRTLDKLDARTRRLLNQRVYYVTSRRYHDRDGDLPVVVRPIAKFLSFLDPDNDGLVFERNQRWNDFGTHLLEIEGASHFSLVEVYSEPRCRREFTRLLFLELARRERRN